MNPMNRCAQLMVLGVLLTLPYHLLAQVAQKREFRGAWIATVVNLDWPSTRGGDPQTQRNELVTILDGLERAGINAVIFQIRPECDAMYPSTIEPWSFWLTGQQGRAPVVPFDPLQFAIQEAHARGMELHAWFNPYRAERRVGTYPLASNHVINTNPGWILTFGSLKMLNPGMSAVRNYIARVIGDVVRRYPEIDGVHFDDYFYPYSPKITTEDQATFDDEPRGFTDINMWRRDNVNIFVKQVYDTILAINPRVKFGISPFGIWKSGTPQGIVGLSAYYDIFCDALAWLQQRTIDYLTPQLYWPFYGEQDYGKLMPWWASVVSSSGRHFYPGHAAWRITDTDHYWGASEVLDQIRLNRNTAGTLGSVFFRARFGITDNPDGFADSLRTDLYKYPALPPIMPWKETTPPNAPNALTITKLNSSAVVSWSAPTVASDGEAASQYVVYRSPSLPINYNDPRLIVSIQTTTSYAESTLPPTGLTYYYAVTALDGLQNESQPSNIMGLSAGGVEGIEQQVSPPIAFRLNQNFPNPFNPTTLISFRIPHEEKVTLAVYDLLGREVRVLVDGIRGTGDHQVLFDASGLPTGVYIYRLRAGEFVESRKMQLVK